MTQDALKLTVRWPARLMGTSLILTTIAVSWLAWREVSGPASAGGAGGPLCSLGMAAIMWTVTLSLLRRWQSADREEHRRLIELGDHLNQRVADLGAEIEQRAAEQRKTDAMLASRYFLSASKVRSSRMACSASFKSSTPLSPDETPAVA